MTVRLYNCFGGRHVHVFWYSADHMNRMDMVVPQYVYARAVSTSTVVSKLGRSNYKQIVSVWLLPLSSMR